MSEVDTTVKLYAIYLCQACIDAIGQECHTPGCAMFLHKVDLGFHHEALTEIEPVWCEKPGHEHLSHFKIVNHY